MELSFLPRQIRDEAQSHISDGYELVNFEDNLLTMVKKKPVRIGLIIINILTLRWVIYIWLPNILVSDLFRVRYLLYIKEEGGKIVVSTG